MAKRKQNTEENEVEVVQMSAPAVTEEKTAEEPVTLEATIEQPVVEEWVDSVDEQPKKEEKKAETPKKAEEPKKEASTNKIKTHNYGFSWNGQEFSI
jgi:hypothetical protein